MSLTLEHFAPFPKKSNTLRCFHFLKTSAKLEKRISRESIKFILMHVKKRKIEIDNTSWITSSQSQSLRHRKPEQSKSFQLKFKPLFLTKLLPSFQSFNSTTVRVERPDSEERRIESQRKSEILNDYELKTNRVDRPPS